MERSFWTQFWTQMRSRKLQSSLVGCHGGARVDIEQTELAAGAEVDVEVWTLTGRTAE